MQHGKLHCTFFLSLTPDMHGFLRSRMRKYNTDILRQPLDISLIDPKTEVLGVFVDSKVTKEVIAKLTHLKLIITFSTGYDHIDIKAAKRHGVTICNVPTYGEDTVAEYTIALLLALSRNMCTAVKRVKQEGTYDYHGLRGFDLKGKTIGVIGTGKIGCNVIKRLHAFDMHIVAYDPYPKKELEETYTVTYVSLNTILQQSDIITLHTPLLPETRYIINKKAIQKMKPSVHIINTARGGLIDSKALLWGLEQNIIASAALDVLDDEDILEDPMKLLTKHVTLEEKNISLYNMMLIDHPRTLVTPHNAFNTKEAVERIIHTAIENIRAFERKEAQNIVT